MVLANRRTRRLAELATRELKGVEILAPGRWAGDQYTTTDIDAMIEAFPALKGTIDPPAKLGHDKTQALAQTDGYPAVGWVERLYRAGDKLLADFGRVPARLAELITAGAYDKVSSEIYFDLEVGGTTWPRVLRAVSFLGADLPAVKDIRSISDVAKLYSAAAAEERLHVAEYTDGVRELEWGDDLPPTTIEAALEATLEDSLRAKINSLRRFNIITETEEDDLFVAVESAEMAFKAQAPSIVLSRPVAGKIAAGYYTSKELPEVVATMDRIALCKALNLSETSTDAEIQAAIVAAGVPMPAPTATATSALTETEARTLREDVGNLTRQLAERNTADAVNEALRRGVIVPAQRDWATDYAAKDLAGFKAYTEATPAVVKPPTGIDGSEHVAEPKALTEDDKSIAAQLGVSEASLARSKAGTPTAVLAKNGADK